MLFSLTALLVTVFVSVQATLPPQPVPPLLPTQLLTTDGTWEIFQFGVPNTRAQPSFQVYLAEHAVLRVTDFWCTGDRFDVYAGDRYLGQTSPSMFDKCYTNTTDINVAFNDPMQRWSRGVFELGPGSYQISIVPVDSPSWTGVGAVSMLPKPKPPHPPHPHPHPHPCPKPCPKPDRCCRGRKGLHMIKRPMSFKEAERACHAMGMRLAEIDIFNFNVATEVALHCAGRFSSSWIRSWNGDKYQGTCLTLDTGVAAPGGAITTPRSCHEKFSALCQEWHHEKHEKCHHEKHEKCHHEKHDHGKCHHEKHDHGKCHHESSHSSSDESSSSHSHHDRYKKHRPHDRRPLY